MPFMVFAAIGANVTTVTVLGNLPLCWLRNDKSDRTQSCMKQEELHSLQCYH